jgi:hypothetical protein
MIIFKDWLRKVKIEEKKQNLEKQKREEAERKEKKRMQWQLERKMKELLKREHTFDSDGNLIMVKKTNPEDLSPIKGFTQ